MQRSMIRSTVLAPVCAVVLTCAVMAQPQADVAARSFVGGPLPELSSEGGTWLNSARPLTLAALRGGPLLLLYSSVF